MTKLDKKDSHEIISLFSNIKYYGKTKNTILHIMGYLHDDYIDENKELICSRIEELIRNVPLVVNNTDTEIRNPMMIYIIQKKQFLLEFIFDIITNRSIHINFQCIDENSNNIMRIACIEGNEYAILKLIELGCPFDISDISKIKDKKIRATISRMFFNSKNIIYEDLEDNNFSFRVYNFNDFKIFEKNIGQGTYGIALDAYDKINRRRCILKKFKTKDNTKLNTDTLKDIMFLKTLNKRNNAVKVYGILTDENNHFYLVIERLTDTLLKVLVEIFSLSDSENRHKQLLQIFKECLICIDGNSKAGIVHGDVKENNMMLDCNNLVKFIDYGWSSFVGISPYINTVNHTIHHAIYTSDDGGNENFSITYKLDDVDTTINKGFYGQNFDIVSIGLMFLQVSTSYKSSFISHRGIIYHHQDGTKLKVKYKRFNTEPIRNIYGDKVIELIIASLEIDPNLRKTAKELLEHEHFIPLLGSSYAEKNVTTVSNGSNSQLNKYNTIFQSNYKKMGYVYFEDIIKHYSTNMVELCPSDFIGGHLRNTCKKFFRDTNTSLDVYYNSLIFINKCVNRSIEFFADDFGNKFYMIFMLAIRFYSYVYTSEFIHNRSIDDDQYILTKLDDLVLFNKCYKFIRDCDYFYDLCPMMTFVGHLKFILQTISTDSNLIYNNIQYIVHNLEEILCSNSVGTFNPHELINEIHEMNPDKIEVL